jgi:hypothetical protein
MGVERKHGFSASHGSYAVPVGEVDFFVLSNSSIEEQKVLNWKYAKK